MSAHAKLSASSSHRWINCPASIRMEQNYPNSSSIYAQEGTCAHALADLVLNGNDGASYIGKELEGFTVSKDMLNHVTNYVDYVKQLGGEQFYEVRVDFSNIVPEGFGTSDVITIVGDTLHVIDLKYGQGERVEAFENTQGLLYAIGALNDYGYIYDIDNIVIHIYQPRINNYSSWELTTVELQEFSKTIEVAAKKALSNHAECNPSEKACKFCKAKAECKALHDYSMNIINGEFDDLTNPDVIDENEIRRIMDNKKLINGWLDAIESHISDKLKSGDTFDGYKLVNGRSTRKWIDNEDDVSAKLSEFLTEDEIFKRSMISPAQAEKLLGKKNLSEINDMIIKSEGSPTLARDDDARKSISEKITDLFE